MLNKSVFKLLIDKFRIQPKLDLFASRLNYQILPFVSYKPDPEAMHVDAFTLDWSSYETLYAFPPFSIINRMLSKIRQDKCEALIIVPNWPNQVWYSVLMKMLIEVPIIISCRKHQQLLICPHNPEMKHPLLPKMKLLACLVSGNLSRSKTFRRRLLQSSLMDGQREPRNNIHRVLENSCSIVLNGTLIPLMQM